MAAYLTRRLLLVVVVAIGVTLSVHLILILTPGDPAEILLGELATRDQIESLRKQLGLDRPAYEQYVRYLGGLLRGDMGRSFRTRRTVVEEIRDAFPATVELAGSALLITILTGVPAGILSAVKRGSVLDVTSMLGALAGVSMPVFWVGLLLILCFSYAIPVFPTGGRGGIDHLVLPAITLSLGSVATMARMVRSAMLEVLNEDYLRTARAKGLPERVVIYKHALKNALIPVITTLGLQVGLLLGGGVLTETVFSWPGMGRLVVNAILMRDILLVQGCVLVLAMAFVLINLLVDLAYAWIDPRIRY